ncbi:MAG TPA: hypothetical protein PKX52_08640, partial [Methanomassiliicoccaceae archaeon]|nr:hypothetical protein [Methanomassiliicoccaceae archaeon]
FWRYEEGLKVPPSSAMTFGTVTHRAIEHNYKHKVEAREDLPVPEIQEVWADEWDKRVSETQFEEGEKPGEVKEYLDRWIANDPRLKNGQPLEAVSGAVSVCAPLDSVTMDNLLLVGDAARMINPITGGGIANSCYAGMFAGKVLAKAAKAKDFSQSMLQEYEDDWRAKMENGLWRDWMAKEKLITLPDETLEMLVEAVSKVDLERITVQTLLAAVKETYPELVKEFEDLI